MAPSAPRPHGRPPAVAAARRTSSVMALLGWAAPLVAFVLLLLVQQHGAQSTCGPGLSTPGVTIPQGDIILLEGDLLELYCVLNLTHPAVKGRNASHLMFYRQNKTVAPEHLHVVNETTLKLTMRPNVSSAMYYCKLNKWEDAAPDVVCLNNVAVGYAPQDVSDFSCISQNWQNLTCTWKKKYNPVKTRYTIWYRLPGRAGGRTKYACPEETDVEEDRCVWNEETNPPYRQPYETYFFHIEAVNHFANSTFNHKFNHYAHVIPAKPEKFKSFHKTAYSVYLEWMIPYPLQNFPPGVIHRVEYLPQWEPIDSWHSVDTSRIGSKENNNKKTLNITSLKYANTFYDIRVYLKSAKAVSNDDSLWSAPAAMTIKTLPDLPGAPPRTDIGSFEVFNHVDSRDIYIYWQTIPDYLQNGDMFSYKIIGIDEDNVPVSKKPAELNKKYAKYSKMDLNKNFRFHIVSANSEGHSLNKSEIVIPSRVQVPPGPLSVTKVFYENGTYELSWKPPSDQEEIDSYTIFWCDSIYDHMCSGYLNWTHVSSNITIKNMTVEDDKPYQFAVSANTRNSSSGMVWASCTILYNKPIQKMKNVWVKKVGSTFMEMVWNLDCLDRNGLVIGFRIYYCPVQHKGPECKSPNQNVTVMDPQQSSANLTGLRPYTTYSISIAVLSSGGESLPSDPLYNVTLEAAPSPPTNVSIVSITNTTVTITWNPPEERNGVITKYEVHYDGKVQTKDNDNRVKQELVLKNLTSYYNYSISVAACTFACSDKSPPLTAETKVGVPGMTSTPHVQHLNQSVLWINWDPPARPSGLLDYYEVLIVPPGGDNSTTQTLRTENTSLSIRIEGCSEVNQPHSFSVRAVNVDPSNSTKTFKGPWSKPQEGSCYTNDLPQYLKIIIYILMLALIICVSCMIICLGKRMWLKCKDMRDVEVKLPPGIVLPLAPERDQDFTMHQWVTHNHDTKPPRPAADEERLLQQKDDHHHDRNMSGDSSGCSSGHESVSSSATSGTHISSDSGTEVDRNEPGFSDPSWEAGSGSDSGSVGKGQQRGAPAANKGPVWSEGYTCVGGKGKSSSASVRSTPNLSEPDPGYTVLSLVSWPSSSSIPDKHLQVQHVQLAQPARGYVALDAASALPAPVAPPKGVKPSPSMPIPGAQPQPQGGYVSHSPPSMLWEAQPLASLSPQPQPQQPPKGYVQTGTKEQQAFTPESEGSWDEPFARLAQQQQQQRQQPSGGYVMAGECGVRPSRTEPALCSALGNGYVMAPDSGLLRDRHKSEASPVATGPGTLPLPLPGAKQVHEYVLTGERDATRDAPLLVLDAPLEPPKAYCRVSEREVRPAAPAVAAAGVGVGVGGYVPHRQLEQRSPGVAPGVAE
ncbi:Cytokine receptor [Frankliniella fusca]|uniref:Cytokine receptor n=1 Tax=Frankliniella fusca TaxID=407009 RepID=A0AAE1H9V8_9NEOP|nr:Cytokine receptor [Frankliniella fusca]